VLEFAAAFPFAFVCSVNIENLEYIFRIILLFSVICVSITW